WRRSPSSPACPSRGCAGAGPSGSARIGRIFTRSIGPSEVRDRTSGTWPSLNYNSAFNRRRVMKQKDAVFAAYQAAVANGMEHGSDALYEQVAAVVQAGIASGEVDYGKDRTKESEVKSYARSLVSNWFKKDERISGAKYVPATRRGPQIKDE